MWFTLLKEVWNPQIQTSDGCFGVQNNQFEFNISGEYLIGIAVEASIGLTDPVWSPLQTNSGSFYFSDPQWTNYPSRFYRIRSP